MKLRPLAGAPLPAERRPAPAPAASPTNPPKQAGPPRLLAAVDERQPDGTVTRLVLPAPLAAPRVPFTVPTVDGSQIVAGTVTADGAVRPGDMGPPDPPPGQRLVCPTGPDGRILLVAQVGR